MARAGGGLVVIVDPGAGNLHSVEKAFLRATEAAEGRGAGAVRVSSEPEDVARAERIVLPGNGAFPACRRGLDAHGLVQALEEAVIARGRPFLGICIGMQMLATQGHEHGTTPGLGWIPGEVVRIEPREGIKIPHMGWNELAVTRPHPVLAGIHGGDHAYFVHSWHLRPADPGHLLASCTHGEALAAVVGRDNILGVQFHPEKSGALGLHLIGNFLSWAP